MRRQLIELLRGGGAHVSFDDAIDGLPAKLRGAKPGGQPHTPWRLVEHMRIAQRDILDFSRHGKHVSPQWPEGYWPEGGAPERAAQWNDAVKQFRADLKAMQKLVSDPTVNL